MGKMDINTAFKKSVFLLGAGASYGLDKNNRTGCKMSGEMFQDLEEKIKYPGKNNLSEIEAEAFRFLISTLYYQNKWRSLNEDDNFEYRPNIEELALIIRRIKNNTTNAKLRDIIFYSQNLLSCGVYLDNYSIFKQLTISFL